MKIEDKNRTERALLRIIFIHLKLYTIEFFFEIDYTLIINSNRDLQKDLFNKTQKIVISLFQQISVQSVLNNRSYSQFIYSYNTLLFPW